MKKILILITIMAMVMFTFSGCWWETEADKVSYNLSLEADNFNVVRQLTVINGITGDTLFQMTGKMSIFVDVEINEDTGEAGASQLEVTVEDENGDYQKHFIGLSDNVTYVVEQLRAKDVEKYKYVINFNPKMWIPVTVDTVD